MAAYPVRGEIDEAAERELAAYSPLLRALLFHRGIRTAAAAAKFLAPAYEDNHDPFLMRGMDEAVERIRRAAADGEKIIVFSDYDADGIPGAVIIHDFLRKIGHEHFEHYIPHRVLEGFGLNTEAIDGFAAAGAKLIITIDCGTANIKEAEQIKKLGIDLIVIDHHLPTIDTAGAETLPAAVAVLNHKQAACGYPDKSLCASGISFKLVQAFLRRHGAAYGVTPGWEKWLLDMAAVATISDMVPLSGENRILASYGLAVLGKSPRPGLQRLLSLVKIEQKRIGEDDVGFMITPRINAASRMGEPMDAFRMLVERDPAAAGAYAEHLDRINAERKKIVAAMVKDIKRHWRATDPDKRRRVLVAGNPDWKPSLLGLVANSLMDEHDGPVFLWGREAGKTLKGSCRAGGRANIVEIMRAAADCFEEYGGHAASGGFTVKFEKVGELADRLEEAYAALGAPEAPAAAAADAALAIDDVTAALAGEIARLAPFGMGNPKPLFVFERVAPAAVTAFGKKKDHLKLDFKQANGRTVSAIAFFKTPDDFGGALAPGAPITLLANIEKSYFLGREEIRLRIVDIAP